MKKKEKRKLLEELLVYYPKGKGVMHFGLLLSALSAVGLMLPVVFLWLAVKEVFLMYPDIVLTPTLKTYVYTSVGSAVIGMSLYCFALLCTHKVAFAVAREMKYATMSHLMKLPLGYYQGEGSGKLRRTISDSAQRTESYIAHQLPDMVSAFLSPLLVIGILFVFDWKLGLISLIPLVLSMVAMSATMGKGILKKFLNIKTLWKP